MTDGSTMPSSRTPTCACPSATRWRGPTALPRRSAASTGRRVTASTSGPDHDAFPCLGLAYEAGRRGETAPAVLNAANEEAVAAFLAGRIRWVAIPDVLNAVLARHDGGRADGVDAVIDADRRGRVAARQEIERISG